MSLSKNVRRTLRSLGAMPQHVYNSPSKFGRSNNNSPSKLKISNNNILHIKPKDINCSKITDASLRRTKLSKKQKMFVKHLCSQKRVANRSGNRSARNRSHSRSLLEKGQKMNNNNRAVQQILEHAELKVLNNDFVRARQNHLARNLQKRVNKL